MLFHWDSKAFDWILQPNLAIYLYHLAIHPRGSHSKEREKTFLLYEVLFYPLPPNLVVSLVHNSNALELNILNLQTKINKQLIFIVNPLKIWIHYSLKYFNNYWYSQLFNSFKNDYTNANVIRIEVLFSNLSLGLYF